MGYEKEQEIVVSILKESWADLKKYYTCEKKKYSQKNATGYFVCWKEDDIVLQLSRFFYRRLSESELKNQGIEIHTQTDISDGKFKNEYTFHEKAKGLKGILGVKPKPDFIITKEDDSGPLWLVGEVKYFREWRSAMDDKINDDLEKLEKLKSLGICHKSVYLIADDFFHPHNRQSDKKWMKFQTKLREEKEKRKIDFVDIMVMCSKNAQECSYTDFAF